MLLIGLLDILIYILRPRCLTPTAARHAVFKRGIFDAPKRGGARGFHEGIFDEESGKMRLAEREREKYRGRPEDVERH